ncbi:uncharacterized protein PAC_02166 [Phialocephala subalpina]|uniref:Mid2 domain-containing protein n=1 Tax=Phialocephala subalpina TaxID=576137 RepID=A0A1L7WHP3_9HELO|nr:uncharacterized protein PAC_02166 [Phialocephala subalpina]
MYSKYYMFVLSWIIGTSFVTASLVSLSNAPQSRNSAFRRALSSPSLKRDIVYKNSTTLDKSWNGAELISFKATEKNGDTTLFAGVDIVCTTCYIKGTASAQLTMNGNFNLTQALQNFTSQIENGIDDLANATVTAVETYFDNVVTDITSLDFNIDDYDFPTINATFDVDIPDIPECQLLVQFDGMELYMEIDTTLSGGATYDLSLYKSETELGVAVGQEELGIIFSIDLILSAEASIDISSGFHIKLDDGVAINLALFSQNISSITMKGGHFEFLPVNIQSAGVVLTALLRLGLQVGINVEAPPFKIEHVEVGTFSSGAAVGVWMNVAEFITNVTSGPTGDGTNCDLMVEEAYSMAIGAQAGATLAILGHTWGPTPNTSTVLFYTTLASSCLATTTSTSAALTARAVEATGLTTTTLINSTTYTGTACLSTGLLNCPVSLQTTSKYTATSTLVTSVPSGSTATWPVTTQNSVANTIAFGTNVKNLESTSGTPTSFVPTTTPTSGITGVIHGKTGGVSNKLIIGLSVGLGVPVLLAIIAGSIFYCRRKRYSAVQPREIVYTQQALSPPEPYTPGSQRSMKKSPRVGVTEDFR